MALADDLFEPGLFVLELQGGVGQGLRDVLVQALTYRQYALVRGVRRCHVVAVGKVQQPLLLTER
ncbi:hypothetical protein D3C76_1324140 [compost metagenome]